MRQRRGRLAVQAVQGIFSLACVVVAAYAFAYLYLAYRQGDPFAARFAVSGWDVPAHFFGAGLALLLVPVQLSQGIRRRWPAVHRTSGALSAAAILIGGVSGLSLAQQAQGGLPTMAGFSLLSLLWLGITGNGIRLAIRGDTSRHGTWMAYSIALTAGAITLRVILGIGTGVLELPFMVVYITAAWASWLLNLAICALWLRVIGPRRIRLAAASPPSRDHGDMRWASDRQGA
jgi:hypothetical protein